MEAVAGLAIVVAATILIKQAVRWFFRERGR